MRNKKDGNALDMLQSDEINIQWDEIDNLVTGRQGPVGASYSMIIGTMGTVTQINQIYNYCCVNNIVLITTAVVTHLLKSILL